MENVLQILSAMVNGDKGIILDDRLIDIPIGSVCLDVTFPVILLFNVSKAMDYFNITPR